MKVIIKKVDGTKEIRDKGNEWRITIDFEEGKLNRISLTNNDLFYFKDIDYIYIEKDCKRGLTNMEKGKYKVKQLNDLRKMLEWFDKEYAFSPDHYETIKKVKKWIDNLLKPKIVKEEQRFNDE